MDKTHVELGDFLKRVRVDESDNDMGRSAKRQETEALRAALLRPPSATSAANTSSDAFGLHEGQSVVHFPSVQNRTGVNSRARADGYMWEPSERQAMANQPYTQALSELARIQNIINRDPNMRFLNMYATKTNQSVRSLYDQDKLRIMATQEAERAHARSLDRERKIVDAPAKEKQIEAMRKELLAVRARHQAALPNTPVFDMIKSPLADYLESGQSESENSLEHLLEARELALFVDRMADLYRARQEGTLSSLGRALALGDKREVIIWVKRIWGDRFGAGTPGLKPGDADYSVSDPIPPGVKDIEQEAAKLKDARFDTAYNDDALLEMLLAGYGLYMCQTDDSPIDTPPTPYTRLATQTLQKALNFFFTGLVKANERGVTPPNYQVFLDRMALFSRTRFDAGKKEEPYNHEAAVALVGQLKTAFEKLFPHLDEEEEEGEGGAEPPPVAPDIRRGAKLERNNLMDDAVAYGRRMSRAMARLVTNLPFIEAPLSTESTVINGFNLNLMNLFLVDAARTRTAVEKWRNENPNGRLSSLLTIYDGELIGAIALGVANSLASLKSNTMTVGIRQLKRDMGAEGMVSPQIIDDAFQTLQVALAGFFCEIYDFLARSNVTMLNEDELAYYRLFNTNDAFPLAPLELLWYTSFPLDPNLPSNPLRLLFATYALNAAASQSKIRLEKILNDLKAQTQVEAGKRQDALMRQGTRGNPRNVFVSDTYTDVDVFGQLPTVIFMHMARQKIKLLEYTIADDRAIEAKIENDIREAERILGDIVAEHTARHGLFMPSDMDTEDHRRDSYQQPLNWAQLPEISGFAILSPNVLGQIDSARITLGDDVPALRDIPLDTLTTHFDSGLAAYFCEYAAVKHARDELGHPTNVGRDKLFAENKRRFFEVLVRLRPYSYSRFGKAINVYRNGSSYPQATPYAGEGGVSSTGLF